MPARHRSRHRAVQLLYQMDMRDLSPESVISSYYGGLYSEEHELQPEKDRFMEELVHQTYARKQEADRLIEEHASNWKIERLPVVERNILRLAISELLAGDQAAPVVIDEALDLARRFAGDEAVPFVNGVLDAVRKESPPA